LALFAAGLEGADGQDVKSGESAATVATVATVEGAAITEAQARGEAAEQLEALELKRLQRQGAALREEHDILTKAAERLIEERLLGLEAAKRGVTKEQLLDQEVGRKVAEPTEEEIDDLYEANRERLNRPKEAVMDQMRQFLRDRDEQRVRAAFLGRLEQEYKVVRSMAPLRFDVKAEGHPALGPDSAPVTLVLFSDFQCPYCRDYAVTLKEVAKNYGDKVRLVFRQFPLTSIHANAERAAEASLCAADQGRFWELHDLMFEHQRELGEEGILAQARQVGGDGRPGLDMDKFKECLAGARHRGDVQADLRAGAVAGTDSTPTLYVNGIHLSGGQPYEVLASAIDAELAKVGAGKAEHGAAQ
jgi:protein-disulfide isomerase